MPETNLDRLKELFPNALYLTVEDVAETLRLATDTVRRKILNGTLNAGFLKVAGSLRVSLASYARYLDALEGHEEAPVLLIAPETSSYSHQQTRTPRRPGPGGKVRTLTFYRSVGFDSAPLYTMKSLLDVSSEFEDFELQSLVLKLAIWLYRLGVDANQEALVTLYQRMEELTPSLDDVEACSQAFFLGALLHFNEQADNIDSLQSLAMYVCESLPKRIKDLHS